jgi:hypothetical protein
MPQRQRYKASNIPFPECSSETIAEAQTKRQIVLDGVVYDRLPFEAKPLVPSRKCLGCNVRAGEVHVSPCPHEKCPRCRCLLLNCECFVDDVIAP